MSSQRTIRRNVQKRKQDIFCEILGSAEDVEIEEEDLCESDRESVNLECGEQELELGFISSDSETDRFSELSEEDECIEDITLKKELANWATQHNITGAAVDGLLKILPKYVSNSDLPKSHKTLLKTPLTYNIRQIGGGTYYHFGLETKILQFYDHGLAKLESEIPIMVGFDGLPLSKSSKMQFWPIFARSYLLAMDTPFLIGLYFSETSKPLSVNEYLEDFVEETRKLSSHGFKIGKKLVKIKLLCIIADAPARNFVKQTVGFNGYHGCDRCTVKGQHNGRVVFENINGNLRTDEGFANVAYKKHQTGLSPLAGLGIGLVSDVVLDYMHLICLGVTRKLLYTWKKGTLRYRLGRSMQEQISSRLVNFKSCFPSQFNRKPRSLQDLEHWKATEYRSFLLYTGPVALKGIIAKDKYDHFLLLSLATRIVLSDKVKWYNYAKELFRAFVSQAKDLYSSEFLVYNVHSLIHIADDAMKFGPLDRISAFPFENSMQGLKRMIRTNSRHLQQVIRRTQESELNCLSIRALKCQSSVISSKHTENVFLSKDGNVILVKHVEGSKASIQKFCKKKPFFSVPCDSSKFGILLVSELSSCQTEIDLLEVGRKILLLPLCGEIEQYVCYPLIN